MGTISTVDELIRAKKLSAEEEEELREIIEECRKREVRIREVSQAARESIEGLVRSFVTIVKTISSVSKAVDELHEEVGRLQLRMMPSSHFYYE